MMFGGGLEWGWEGGAFIVERGASHFFFRGVRIFKIEEEDIYNRERVWELFSFFMIIVSSCWFKVTKFFKLLQQNDSSHPS